MQDRKESHDVAIKKCLRYIYIYIYIYVYVIYCRAGNYYPGFGSDPRSVAKIGYSG